MSQSRLWVMCAEAPLSASHTSLISFFRSFCICSTDGLFSWDFPCSFRFVCDCASLNLRILVFFIVMNAQSRGLFRPFGFRTFEFLFFEHSRAICLFLWHLKHFTSLCPWFTFFLPFFEDDSRFLLFLFLTGLPMPLRFDLLLSIYFFSGSVSLSDARRFVGLARHFPTQSGSFQTLALDLSHYGHFWHVLF